MEIKKRLNQLTQLLLKYKYVFAVLAIGLVLMAIPGKSTEIEQEKVVTETTTQQLSPEQTLADILSCIHGAGEVRVMLTLARGEETVYQTDDDTSTGTDSSSESITTVTVTDSERNQYGLVKQINPPQYLGAIIVCSGADEASVRLAIVDAVSKVTGLGANQISVLKMK